MREERVEANGIRLSCRMSGSEESPPLVLLHALGEDARDWDEVAPSFAQQRRVYAVDLRGHGRSEWPGSYSLELMRADVLALLDVLGLDRVDLIGHSLGGVVSYLVAAAAPGRVRRLVLEDVPAPHQRQANPPERPDGDLTFDWDMVIDVRAQVDDPDPAWRTELTRITAGTLAIWGGPTSPVAEDGVADLARRVPRGRMVTIDAGHLVHATRPQEFLAAVLPFLDEG